jgi:hypothetical protein
MIITAEELINSTASKEFWENYKELKKELIEKIINQNKEYVSEAIKQASEQPCRKEVCENPYQCTQCQNDTCDYPTKYIEQSLILNAYPLTNIK